MSYNVVRRSALLDFKGKDWLGQCQDNVIEWEIGPWSPVGKDYKIIISDTITSRYLPPYDLRCYRDVNK